MQRTKMSMIAVAGAAVVVSTMAATAAEASPMVTHTATGTATHTATGTATHTATDTATEQVPGVVGDTQATAYGKISKAGLRPGMSATTHPVPGEILYVLSQTPKAGTEAIKGTTVTVTSQTFNQQAAAYAQTLEGIPYLYGGTTKQGFDCSGLTQYVYNHDGKEIVRTADEQFHQFRGEAHSQAQPGDLVFFHDTSNLQSHVYHVGVFEGGTDMVAATQTGSDVQFQSYLWGGNTVSFGTVSH
jgi:cell wall-associated NlpC family hydrolase